MIPPDSMLASLHESGDLDPNVRSRVWGSFSSLGGRVPTFEQLRDTAARMAKHGYDPRDNSVLEVGLLLPVPEYEALVAFVKTLDVPRATRRRRRPRR